MGEPEKDNGSQLSLTDIEPSSPDRGMQAGAAEDPSNPPEPPDERPAAAPPDEGAPASAEEDGTDYSSWEETEEAADGAPHPEAEQDDEDELDGDDEDGDLSDEEESWSVLAGPDQTSAWNDNDEVEPTLEHRVEDPSGPPSLEQIARDPRRSRLVGAVLGAAIGDAVGNPTEFITSFEAIRRRYPPDGVKGFVLYREGPEGRFAPFTDDTQMAEVVLRSLLWGRENGADLEATMTYMGKGFVEWASHPKGGHRAPGNACLSGCRAMANGVHWSRAGGPRAGGCGSVMRAYPFGLVFADDLRRAESWSVAHSKMTHGDPIALAASAAMAVGMARVLRDEPVTRVLSEMVAAACRYSARTAAMMATAIEEAETGVEPEVTLERLEGWAAHEAIAAAVYLFARHPDDPRATILEAANTPGDSDSLATLAGALTGCRCGVAAIPKPWVGEVERSPEFIELACRI